MALMSFFRLALVVVFVSGEGWEPKHGKPPPPAPSPEELLRKTTRGGRRKPLITMQHVYGAVGLLRDFSDAIWDLKFRDLHARHIAPHTAEFDSGADVLMFVAGKVGMEAKVRELIGKVSDAFARKKASHAKVMAELSVALSRCRTILEVRGDAMARHFALCWDIFFPRYAGMVPGTVSDVTVFLIYITILVYVGLRVLFKLLRAALRIACCIMCCPRRCCCSGRTEAGKELSRNGRTENNGQLAAKSKASSKKK